MHQEARQQKLQESYRFSCRCQRCVREAPNAESLHGAAAEFRQVRTVLEAANTSGELGEEHAGALERCAELLDILTPRATSHPEPALHLLMLGRLYSQLHAKVSVSSEVAKGNKAGAKQRKAQLAYRSKAVTYLERAQDMMRVSMGADHPLQEPLFDALHAVGAALNSGDDALTRKVSSIELS